MAKPDAEEQLRLDSATVWDTAPGIPEWAYEFHRHVYQAVDVSRLAEMYEEGGRKPVSPRLLAAITILQYMHRASDREAVENTLVRRDWRVALGLTSEYEGFHPTVLVRFRQRLIAAGLEEELFSTVLGAAERLGMLTARRRLRVDGTKLLADVSMLSRGDLIRETMRVVLSELERVAPALEHNAEFVRLEKQYGEESWLGRLPGRADLVTLAQDGYAVLALCEGHQVAREALLRRVLSEHFVIENGEPRPLDNKELSLDRLRTPHDPDVQIGYRRGDLWLGEQVHLLETADEDLNLVVGVLVMEPQREDSTVLAEARELGLARVPEAEMLLADTGYASVANSIASEEAGVMLVSPPRPDTHTERYRPADFEIDFEARTARCPAKQPSRLWTDRADGSISIGWSDALCAACPQRGQCTTSKEGRQIHLSRDWERLRRERAQAREHEFWEEYRHRAGIEATISELVRRHGLRRSRYRGAPRRRLHAILSATALNAKRLLRWVLDPEADAILARRREECAACA
jgi:transposase